MFNWVLNIPLHFVSIFLFLQVKLYSGKEYLEIEDIKPS